MSMNVLVYLQMTHVALQSINTQKEQQQQES